MFEITHSKLGKIVYEDEGWWRGEKDIDNFKIEIFVGGDESGVSKVLAEDCFEVLSNFSDLKQKALIFLKQESSRLKIKQELQFTPTGIFNFFQESKMKGFTMGFSEKSKPDFLWRVEFENSEPKCAGFDS